MSKKKIEKYCTSCGENGHHYNDCKKVPFFGMLAAAVGIWTIPICGMSEEEIIKSVNENAIWNK